MSEMKRKRMMEELPGTGSREEEPQSLEKGLPVGMEVPTRGLPEQDSQGWGLPKLGRDGMLPGTGTQPERMQSGGLLEQEDGGRKAVNLGMTKERLHQGIDKLVQYISDKAATDNRIVTDEQWWERRAWSTMQNKMNAFDARRPTNWLWNVILGKHADMLEAYPEPIVLPREEGDKEQAKQLSAILPVVMEQNDFEHTYSDQCWEKNKHGSAVYGVFWDSKRLNGLGDVAIEAVDVLNLFFERGINDIQDSENVFLVKAVSKDRLIQEYPQLADKQLGGAFSLRQYMNENRESTSDKAMVVDWYYKQSIDGQTVLQYCKFVGDEILYASEDDPEVGSRGWYEDGEYPFVIDTLFPKKGTCLGEGYIDVGRGPQESIDLMDQAMVMNALAGSIPRFLVTDDSNVNEQEFADFRKHFVHVTGASMNGIQPINTTSLSATHMSVLNNKIEELKQTTGNQDVSNGATSGVTAASAIAALQESAGRSSRDSIKGTYRAYRKIIKMVIERIRQFYDTPRTFRILGEGAEMDFVHYDNSKIVPQQQTDIGGVDMGLRLPVFDVNVQAQKNTSYTRMAQNELALQLLGAGVFNMQMADQSLMLLDMMDFPDKDKLIQRLHEGQTMQQQLAMWQQMALQMANKYEPRTAQEMTAVMQAQGGPLPQGQLPQIQGSEIAGTKGESSKEASFMDKARAGAQAASQPT